MVRSLTPNRRRTVVKPRVKLWLEAGNEQVLCSGLSEMLKAVDETGSIKEAAATVERSYRFVWSKIKDAERSLGAALVETHVGGHGAKRSELTPLARDLLQDFDLLRQEVFHLVDDVFRRRLESTLRRNGHLPSPKRSSANGAR